MISIALVLLLMLGINQVFKVTGEAVGTSQSISEAVRNSRAAQAIMTSDFGSMLGQAPGVIIIRSERVSAFRNRQDELADRDWDPTNPSELPKRTIDIDRNGIEGEPGVLGEIVLPALYGNRSHRIDRICFFARGTFPRQTGGALDASGNLIEQYIADMTCPEAWIWYGHLKRPDEKSPVSGNQAFEHRNPGENPNPSAGRFNDRNFHATDFVLGRMAMLLNEGIDTDVPPDGVGDVILDKAGVRQRFIRRTDRLIPPLPPGSLTLSPLIELVRSNEPNPADRWQIQWSRYDLVNTSIAQYGSILTDWIADNPPTYPPDAGAWFNQLSDWRFQGDPLPLKPLNPDNLARTAPVFLERCTQFIVEFAGDFLTQNPDTGVVDPLDGYKPDGLIDFLIDNSTGIPIRRVRWYGMPRDVAGAANGGPDGTILGGSGVGGDTNRLVDVVPLRDVLVAAGVINVPPPELFIERRFPQANQNLPPPVAYTATTGGMPFDARYIVAWGPDTDVSWGVGTGPQPRPSMFRIVYTIDDPTGRIAEGQTFEYVFKAGG